MMQRAVPGPVAGLACRAGDDLVQGQLTSGNYRNSCFELNPYTGGTPHVAIIDRKGQLVFSHFGDG